MGHHPHDFFGTAGNDVLTGANNIDTFHMQDGGDDTVLGKKGADVFLFGATLTAADRVSGGLAHDLLVLDGDYASGLHLVDATLTGVETIQVTAGNSYSLWFADGNVDPGMQLKLEASGLAASDSVALHGGSERDGSFRLVGGVATAFLQGGSGDDIASGNGALTCDFSLGGNDTAAAGSGGSQIDFGAAFNAGDSVTGGPGIDVVTLDGDYASGVTLTPTTLRNIDTLSLADGFSYSLTTDNGNVSVGKTMFVDASALTSGSVTFDARAESDGSIRFDGGDANVTFNGGARSDDVTLGSGDNLTTGNAGGDVFHADPAGNDTFVYLTVGDSTGLAHDVFDVFSFANFRFDLDVSVTGIDATITGQRLHAGSESTFNADLVKFADAAHLAANHALVIVSSGGAVDGHAFVVVDANGIAGYQANADYVIDIGTNFPGGGTLTLGNFV